MHALRSSEPTLVLIAVVLRTNRDWEMISIPLFLPACSKMTVSTRPTEVCITVDTEFSVGGAFWSQENKPVGEPIVLGTIHGKEEGLGFLLDTLAQHEARATFFVETLQTAYFGDEPMGTIARRIANAGHDVQLHLHPSWLHFESSEATEPLNAKNDSCAGRTEEELDRIIERGCAAFSRWGLSRPTIVRTGNFEVDVNFYKAAARAGITTSSNIALSVFRPPEGIPKAASGAGWIEGILELPVLTYIWRLGTLPMLRPLTITGCSVAEMRSILRQARERGISPVIVLTHPQEYIKKKDFRYNKLRRNRVNQGRLKALLSFLRENSDDFVAVPVSKIERDRFVRARFDSPSILVSFGKAIARLVENGVNDRIWWY